MAIMRIVFYSWIFSWICLVFCGISLGTGAYFIEFAKMHDGTGYQSILLDLTMAGNLYTLVVCSIFYLNHGKSKQTIAMIGIILSLIFIIILGKRTPLLVSICLIILYILKFHGFTGKIKKSIVCYVGILLIILMILVVKIQGLSEQIGLVWEHSIGGVLDMINGTSTTGAAAVARYKFRQWAYMYIENNFTPFNYIFGAGFMTKWLDAPLLQAYLDMGIIGFCFYFYYVIVKPLRITFSKLSKNSLVFWGCALNFYNILSAFNSGIPYGHVRWIPLIGLLLTIHYTRQRELRQN
ncbi:MAG: hypothetical protein HDQ88_05595 [Clostridia bacterium]|nr:hypothetical protein [Clostridia bacterium]